MIKIKYLPALILCTCLPFSTTCITYAETLDSSNTTVLSADLDSQGITVHLTGNGIATRLHQPVLLELSHANELPHITIKSVHLAEDSSETIADSQSPNETNLGNVLLILGSPVYKHKPHILANAKKYKKILCEKPVGLSMDEIRQIKDAINQNNVLFTVNYALRFLPCIEEIKEFIKNNEVKRITITCNADFNQTSPNKAWKNDYRLGGGILYSILPHMIDLLNYLNFQEEPNNITFQSTTQVPMNDIRLFSKTSSEVNTEININLCENFHELTLKVETADKSKTFDLINSSVNKIDGTRYYNGTLSATSETSPWRISFKHLLKNYFTNPHDPKFARIEDAENVHKVLEAILLQPKKC